MSAVAQIARLVEPFLDRHPEFALAGRSVVMRPVSHLVRGFFVDRSSGKGQIQPNWYVATTFAPPPQHLVGAGARLVRGVGSVEDPQVQARLLDEMEEITSGILITAEIDNIPALGWQAEPIFGPRPMAIAFPLLAKGAFAEAAPYFSDMKVRIDSLVQHRMSVLKKRRSADSRPARIDAKLLEQLYEAQRGFRTLCDLLAADDVRAIAAQLHQWEAAAVRMHKLEHLWVRSPFPFERGAD